MTQPSPLAAKPNRLIHEKSPYLLQHANNPVDWYPWGEDAFEKAKRENKPMLISIGYSTCHWCHVMEHESFEDPKIAELMNTDFVCIKVDREERPDVDAIYMSAAQAMAGQGGWPLNVFVTPDRKPFFAGTYFPPEARWGHPGWPEVLSQIAAAWKNPSERSRIEDIGQNMSEALAKHAAQPSVPMVGDDTMLNSAFKAFQESFDAGRGGFSKAPKFPMPVYHNLLLRLPQKEALEMSLTTLRAMARGGIYDQIGGGFSRYSTDAQWHIPHFEKMLYDNAQLAVTYLEAYQKTNEPEFRKIVEETLAYILREMRSPEGAFYSAQDADSLPSPTSSKKVEGAFYVWEKSQISSLLGPSSEMFFYRYGVRDQGNVASDPHGDFLNKNILYQAHSVAETAREFKMSPQDLEKKLAESNEILLQARSKRPHPHLDDKIISAWNGLMISAFARAYQVLGNPAYVKAAQKAASFIKENLWNDEAKHLRRSWRQNQQGGLAVADDYSFMVQALLDLYETDFDIRWLKWAIELDAILVKDFQDAKSGGFFMTSEKQDKNLLYRIKEAQDNVEPSASSIAALNALRLAQLTGDDAHLKVAEHTLRANGIAMKSAAKAMPQMLVALQWLLSTPKQIVIAGKPDSQDTRALLEAARKPFLPNKVVILADGGEGQRWFAERLDYIKTMTPIGGKATAFLCEHKTCQKPVSDPQEWEILLSRAALTKPEK